VYSFLEKKEDFYRGFTSKPRQMPIKSINSRKFNYLLTFNSLSYTHKKGTFPPRKYLEMIDYSASDCLA
uniref:hypothetical protein n=1 Tax=Catenibacterium mitsuokai TaxID=100886 RepID=UPI002E7693B5